MNFNFYSRLSGAFVKLKNLWPMCKLYGNDLPSISSVLAVCAYMSISICCVIVTRNVVDHTIPAPFFVSWFQQIVGIIFFNFMVTVVHTSNSWYHSYQLNKVDKINSINPQSIGKATSNIPLYDLEIGNQGNTRNSHPNNEPSIHVIEATDAKTVDNDSIDASPITHKHNVKDEDIESWARSTDGDESTLLEINRESQNTVFGSVLNGLCHVFPQFDFDMEYIKMTVLLSIFFAGMVGFSNLCLHHVPISTYQIARSGTLIVNLILSVIWLKQTVTRVECLCCVVVSSGFFISLLDRAALSATGAIAGFISSIFQSVYSVYMKHALQNITEYLQSKETQYMIVNRLQEKEELLQIDSQGVILKSEARHEPDTKSLRAPNQKGNEALTRALCQYYNMVNALFAFPVLIALGGEIPVILEYVETSTIYSLLVAILHLSFSGLLTFTLAMSIFWLVSVTSPLTLTVSGYVKTALQSLIAVVAIGEIMSPIALCGFLLTLLGSICYSLGSQRK